MPVSPLSPVYPSSFAFPPSQWKLSPSDQALKTFSHPSIWFLPFSFSFSSSVSLLYLPSSSCSLSSGLSGSIRSVVRSMAEAEAAALLSALHHNTSLQLTAGLQNAPCACTYSGTQERAQTGLHGGFHQLRCSHTLADARKIKNKKTANRY